jgi:nitrile hydratase subunit beta
MNGAHDLGGWHGFGPVLPEADEPVFRQRWESRVFALHNAMLSTGAWSLDEVRATRERLPAAVALSVPYYETFLAAVELLALGKGLVGDDELAAGQALRPAAPVRRVLLADGVPAAVAGGHPPLREPAAPARFAVGDRVRARQLNPPTHTRLPRYVRGHVGTVVRLHGCHVFPDSHAHGLGEDPQWLYGVQFAARDLWGGAADPTVRVSVDAYEPYLEAAR